MAQIREEVSNRGNDEGAGNPVNPDGHRSAYLWEQVWERHSWLEIMGRYLIHERNSKRKISRLIFPRYHQLDVTRKLQAAVLADGVGAAPLRLIEDPPAQRRWTELVPYVDLAVAAGSFSAAQDAGQAQLEQSRFWVEVAEHRVKRGYFAARIEGHSMEPQIEDGSLCLFEPVLGAPKTGSIVLAALRDQSDSEHGGRYTIKTYRSEKTTDENGVAQNTVIHLEPKNPAYPRLSFTAENGEGLTILAKYAATLTGA